MSFNWVDELIGLSKVPLSCLPYEQPDHEPTKYIIAFTHIHWPWWIYPLRNQFSAGLYKLQPMGHQQFPSPTTMFLSVIVQMWILELLFGSSCNRWSWSPRSQHSHLFHTSTWKQSLLRCNLPQCANPCCLNYIRTSHVYESQRAGERLQPLQNV
jgi:hypothetical protein